MIASYSDIHSNASADRPGRWAYMDRSQAAQAFERVPYDHLTAAARIRNAGLPEWVAHRVEHGR